MTYVFAFSYVVALGNYRIAVIKLHKSEMKTANIVRTTDSDQRIVYRIIKRFREIVGTLDRPGSGRPTIVTTPDNIQRVNCRIQRDPVRLIKNIAKKLGIIKFSFNNVIKRN